MIKFLIFISGVILGFLLAFAVFLCYIYLELKGKNKIHQAIQKVEEKARPQAKIFMPPSEEAEAQEEIIKRNAEKGRDTKAEELGL